MQTEHIPLSGFFQTFCSLLIRQRWWWLALVLLITVFFGVQIRHIRFDNSADIWFVEGHPSLAAKARFDATFGNDEFVYLLFTAERTPFTPENFKLMAELARTLERHVPYTKRVVWLGNAELIEGREDAVEIRDFMPELPKTTAEIAARLDEALTEPTFVANLVSADKSALTMTLELNTYPPREEDLTPQKTVVEKVDEILAEPRFAALKPWLAGPPVSNIRYTSLVRKDMGKFFGLVVLVQALMLLFFGRGPRAVLTPLVITSLGVFWTLGTIGLLGYSLNLLSSALPTMLICVGIADAVHLIAAFHHEGRNGFSRKAALENAMGEVGLAMLLTSLTTSIGFLAYLTCQVAPYRDMGVYVAYGVAYTFLLTIILTPIIYSFGKQSPPPESEGKKNQDIIDRILRFSLHLASDRPKATVAVFLAVMVLTFVGFLQVKVESDSNRLIFKGQPLRDTLDEIDARMGTGMSLELLIDTGKESGVKTPDFMDKLDRLMQAAESHPLVRKADSVVPVLKKMRQAMHGKDPAFYSLPETEDAVAQYLYLYEGSGGDALDRQLGFRYDVARLSLKFPSLDTGQSRELMTYMESKVDEIFGPEVTVMVSGGLSRYLELNDILYQGQRHSFIAATLAIGLVMVLVLRSLKLGLLSMIPNVFPVFFVMGFLGLIGHYLDVITISFAGVIIGVAVDDTIHFFTRFKQEFALLGRYREALAATCFSVGRPIVQTTILLVVGNSVLLFSSLLGFFKLGMLFAVAFGVALLADLWFAPALIVLLKPLGPEREAVQTPE